MQAKRLTTTATTTMTAAATTITTFRTFSVFLIAFFIDFVRDGTKIWMILRIHFSLQYGINGVLERLCVPFVKQLEVLARCDIEIK